MYNNLAVVAKERLDSRVGPRYRKEKMKVKRSSDVYVGKISQRVNSTKFINDEEPEQEEEMDVGRSASVGENRASVGSSVVPPREKNIQQKPQPVKKSKRIVFSD